MNDIGISQKLVQKHRKIQDSENYPLIQRRPKGFGYDPIWRQKIQCY
ncbi:hypothetical protein Zm00014a_005921 [Zea mays]|uniref:Uncharacterized protein n=1 Tax=Zea mays TaxID=4577 RepID=A0A3L6FHE0_MAIZE|nr:hypothetical protein Zm00014a_005921 [Zea mays]